MKNRSMKSRILSLAIGCLGVLWAWAIGIGLQPAASSAEVAPAVPAPQMIATDNHRMPNAQSAAFSPDGKLVAAGLGGPSNGRFPLKPVTGGVAVWRVDTGERVQFVGEYGDIVSLAFTADSKSLLYGRLYTPGDSVDDHGIMLVDIASGEKVSTDRFGRSYLSAASPVADLLLVGQSSRTLGRLSSQAEFRAGNEEGTVLELEGCVSSRGAAFSPEGSSLALLHGRHEPILDRDGRVRPDVKRVARTGLTRFDVAQGKPQLEIVSELLADCHAVTASPQGALLATGHPGGLVRIWPGQSAKPARELAIPTQSIQRPVFSSDGAMLAVLSQVSRSQTWRYAATPSGFILGEEGSGVESEVIFFDTTTFSPVRHWQFKDAAFRTWHANRPHASLNPQRIAFSPDGKQLLIGAGGLSLIEVATGKVVRQFDLP